ncbi:hypothetical protein FOA52_008569 [Chlamydomonas sp. UWO 241]|nr:hypothetical protein FOA52_008569 [Chlamydomonas sp. UWO 241]
MRVQARSHRGDSTRATWLVLLLVALVALQLGVHGASASVVKANATGVQRGVLQGTLRALVGERSGGGGPGYRELYLRTLDARVYALDLPPSTPGAPPRAAAAAPGDAVEVTFDGGAADSSGGRHGRRTLLLDHQPRPLGSVGRGRHLQQAPSGAPTAPKGPVRMLVYIMDLSECGTAGPAVTPDEVRAFLGGGAGGANMAGLYDACTLGTTTLDAAGSVVVSVPFPCDGVLADGTRFSTDTCAGGNVLSWQLFAEEAARAQGVAALESFHHRVVILPRRLHDVIQDCYFDALASQGIWDYVNDPSGRNTWGYGFVWMCGDCWDSTANYWHELGHNYGVEHARSEAPPLLGDTLDTADAMGSWGGQDSRCHNAPHLWTMGWSTPAGTLAGLRPGLPPRLVSMPLQGIATPGVTGILLSPTAPSAGSSGSSGAAAGGSFVASFRAASPPYDVPFGLTTQLSTGVALHRVPSGVKYTDTALVAILGAVGDEWTDAGSLLSVTLVSLTPRSATVAVCVRAAAGSPCYELGGALEGGAQEGEC